MALTTATLKVIAQSTENLPIYFSRCMHFYDGFQKSERERDKINFIYSEKATKFCAISPLLLSYLVPGKRKLTILQNFVVLSEYMNFNKVTQKLRLPKNVNDKKGAPKLVFSIPQRKK